MLVNLYVKNFAIIKEINIDFEKGLNILSGETGSGKSLLLKALSILKGERFNKNYIGVFGDKTIVEAIFSTNQTINKILEENDIDIDSNIVLSRTFTENSSITKINNRACNIKFLGEISSLLFDIHGQHSNLVVLNKNNYISLIDKFNEKTDEYKLKLSNNLRRLQLLNKENQDLNMSDDEIEREKDLLTYQINEIENFDFDSYDEDSLNKEYKKLSNQSELISGTNSIINFLSESSRIPSFKEMSQILYDNLVDLENLDEDLNTLVSDALNIKELIKDLSEQIERYSYSLDIDEERIQIIEELFSSFQVLKLKYGRNSEEILGFLGENKKRYKIVSNIHARREEIQKDIDDIKRENIVISKKLNEIRKDIIKYLETKIINELNEMNMQYIDFKIDIKINDKITKEGFDEIDFLISTNKGQELKSLSEVSSGGEISRFMLAMKAAFIEKEDIDTIIFDEIDSGISGKTADIVGSKLKKISNSVQLIVISHLAQIASKANANYLLSKKEIDGFTQSSIEKLNYDNTIKEIARLISGSDITEKSLISAEELLKEDL